MRELEQQGGAAQPADAERVDMRAMDAAEKTRFHKREKQRIAAAARERDGPPAGERILGLVGDLNEPRVVRDYDAEIGELLNAASRAVGSRERSA